MFRSIKTKIIVTVMVFFLLGITIMTAISSTKVKNRTEEYVINSSGAVINEMGFAIENYLGQYENGLAQLSTSSSITNFTLEDSVEAESLLKTLNQELSSFLELYKFFLELMHVKQNEGDKEAFTYFTSAFTSAARSILQYCHDFDKSRYNKSISTITLSSKFKKIRDANIHASMIQTVGVTSDSIEAVIEVNGNGDIEETVVEEILGDDQVNFYFVGEDIFDEELPIVKQSNAYLIEIEDFLGNY